MKFIHTADIRLDRCYADLDVPPEVGRENRAHLRLRLQSILERAQETGADALIISGNLIELDRVDRDTVAFLREAFEGIAPIPVLINPGPLDPYLSTSPYATELWPENVHLFPAATWTAVSINGISIFGRGYSRRYPAENPFDSFEVPADSGPFMVLGAGIVPENVTEENQEDIIIPLERLAHPKLAYIALGHSQKSMAVGAEAGVTAWYAGAPESAGFNDVGPYGYLEVTIDVGSGEGENDAIVTNVNVVPLGTRRFFKMALDCTDLPSGQAVLDVIRPQLAAETDCQCARIVLEGALLPEIYDEMTSIREALAEEVLYLDLVDRCFVAENYVALAEQKTSLGAFVARINREIDDAPDGERRAALCRSRDLALCAYRGQHLPIRVAHGD